MLTRSFRYAIKKSLLRGAHYEVVYRLAQPNMVQAYTWFRVILRVFDKKVEHWLKTKILNHISDLAEDYVSVNLAMIRVVKLS